MKKLSSTINYEPGMVEDYANDQSPATVAIEKLNRLNDRAENILVAMEKILLPVLMPDNPHPETSGGQEKEQLPPLFDELRALSNRLEDRLESMARKLDRVRI